MNHVRYNLNHADLGPPANVNREAIRYKKCCGYNCYNVAALQETLLGRMKAYRFRVWADGTDLGELSSVCFMICNGKYCGGGMVINPFGAMNDGLMDLLYVSDPKLQTLWGMADVLNKANKLGGTHVYDQTSTFLRCKKLVMEFKGVEGQKEMKT
jgi:diacylglycerol kinase family enzyme